MKDEFLINALKGGDLSPEIVRAALDAVRERAQLRVRNGKLEAENNRLQALTDRMAHTAGQTQKYNAHLSYLLLKAEDWIYIHQERCAIVQGDGNACNCGYSEIMQEIDAIRSAVNFGSDVAKGG